MQGRWREAHVKWRGLIAEQSGSGQSAAVFCRDRSLTTGQLFAWKSRCVNDRPPGSQEGSNLANVYPRVWEIG
jgi:hypothetical protein